MQSHTRALIAQRLTAFATRRTPAIRDEDFRTFVVLNVACLSAMVIHVGIIPLFAWLGVWPLVLVNVPSVLLYVAALRLNRRGLAHVAIALCFVELAVHQSLCVVFLGWAAGFQYYLLAITGVAAYLPANRRAVQAGAILGAGGVYIVLAHVGEALPPIYPIDETILTVMRDVNIAVVFPLLGFFAWHFHRAAVVAEERLAEEHARAQRLLHNILPAPIVERLADRPTVIADGIDSATILFADIVGFTPLSARLPPKELVSLLNEVFSDLDELTAVHGLEKIKTIGDAYMVAAGIPQPREDHAHAVAAFAVEMKAVMARRSRAWGAPLELRVGIHSGPVVAGVIGTRKFSYDVWGDSVNTAARMESHGLPGEIQVTEATRALLGGAFEFAERGLIDVKGKGPMRTWLLRGGAGPQP